MTEVLRGMTTRASDDMNEALIQSFSSKERGLHEGDPISPYLFFFSAEALGHLLTKAKTEGELRGVALQVDISRVFGVRVVEKHEKYLGFPTLVASSKKETFQNLKDRIWKRLRSWECKNLSQAKKVVLLKSVVQAMPQLMDEEGKWNEASIQAVLRSEDMEEILGISTTAWDQDHDDSGIGTVEQEKLDFAWTRYVQIALGAESKIDFIDGSCVKPMTTGVEQEQWRKADCMVFFWLLNSISKDIVEAFLYTSRAGALWMKLESRFGESNGSSIYQLQREIASISQGNLCLDDYFIKLTKLCEGLVFVAPPPICKCGLCVCGCAKAISEITASNQWMQFLMGLNETYDHIRSQISAMDPLLDVNKAFSMVLRVERQKDINLVFPDSGEAVALEDQKTKGGKTYAVNVSEEMKDDGGYILELVKVEILKLMRKNVELEPVHVNYARLDEFAGLEELTGVGHREADRKNYMCLTKIPSILLLRESVSFTSTENNAVIFHKCLWHASYNEPRSYAQASS
ncbi:hypothetical protein Sango_1564800 [Sesamum angolense]|uniref:Retrotransposon gag domain-containing protein n=1 Tax=Sesamum angolense TaxID=2727404 RepID=A0AAE1WPJ9_9LAMI|nr:hypothetical protein Sango_1564800 [Sesamum angolense]